MRAFSRRLRLLKAMVLTVLPACAANRCRGAAWAWSDDGSSRPAIEPFAFRARATELEPMATGCSPAHAGQERFVLGRDAVRFRVDRSVIVEVASPKPSVPFWIGDLGFSPEASDLRVAGQDWAFPQAVPRWLGTAGGQRTRLDSGGALSDLRPGGRPGRDRAEDSSIDQSQWRCVPARVGASAAFDVDLPIGRMPERLNQSWLLQPAHDQRHSTVLARGRVWKTHDASGPIPDQVAVAFGSDPARSLVWTWRTEPCRTRSLLRLARARPQEEAPDPSMPERQVEGDSTLVTSPSVLNDPLIRRHRARLDDLRPDTTYAYCLGDGSPGGWTPWKTVRTGLSSPAMRRRFEFLYMGDPQCGLEEWGKLLAGAHRCHPNAAFLLIAGDLVDRGNERTNWDHFFLRAAGVFETLPLMPCAGDHE